MTLGMSRSDVRWLIPAEKADEVFRLAYRQPTKKNN